MQWKTVDILFDEQRRDKHETELAARHDLVPDRCADELAVTRRARELLAQVAPHDHLRGDQLDYLADVVPNANAIGAARRARTLLG